MSLRSPHVARSRPVWTASSGTHSDAMLVTGQPQYVGLSQTPGGRPRDHQLRGDAVRVVGRGSEPPGRLRTSPGMRDPAVRPIRLGPDREGERPHVRPRRPHGRAAIITGAPLAPWATRRGHVGGTASRRRSVQKEVKAAAGPTSRAAPSGPIATPRPASPTARSGATLRATFYRHRDRPVEDGYTLIPLAYRINDLGRPHRGADRPEVGVRGLLPVELVAPAPSGMPTLAPSTPEPEPTFDCSVKPPGGSRRRSVPPLRGPSACSSDPAGGATPPPVAGALAGSGRARSRRPLRRSGCWC